MQRPKQTSRQWLWSGYLKTEFWSDYLLCNRSVINHNSAKTIEIKSVQINHILRPMKNPTVKKEGLSSLFYIVVGVPDWSSNIVPYMPIFIWAKASRQIWKNGTKLLIYSIGVQ